MTRSSPEPASGAGAAIEQLVDVVAALREHCLWTAALTHESLIAYLIEESYELADVVEAPGPLDAGELKGELGDILYQVLLHARLQEESGGFALADVAEQLRAKLIRRNSHVFRPDGTLQPRFPETIAEIEGNYAAVKAAERDSSGSETSVFDSLPASMPALALAAKTLDRAGGRDQGLDKRDHPQTEDELGEMLLDVVRAAREQGLDAERALRAAVRRLQAATGN
jgi:uncharacterized protein YabN with tetrapyrrole methylase and pyrophosphatase domain